MLTWVAANLATILICLVLIGIVAAIIVSIVKGKKKGKSACGCGCASCPMSGSCSSSHKKH